MGEVLLHVNDAPRIKPLSEQYMVHH